MATQFARTYLALNQDRPYGLLAAVLCAITLGGAVSAWSALVEVPVYEVTNSARLEVDRAAHLVQSPLTAKVTRVNLAPGNEVQAGDILLELDHSSEKLQAEEQLSRIAAIGPELNALRAQAAAEELALQQERASAGVAGEEAQVRANRAEVPAAYSAEEEERLRKLRAQGLIAEREYLRGRAEAQQAKLAAETDRITIRRLEQEQQTRERDRAARLRGLNAEIVRLEGQILSGRAVAARLNNEIERRILRAPVSGRLAEAAVLRPGSVLEEGQTIASIVPSGALIAVAMFPPPAAFGRLRKGQAAQLRLQAYPWTQYGALRAHVRNVASEVREGNVRVELAVHSNSNSRIPLQHGLPGAIEVEVERVTPLALVLRNAGRLLTSPRSRFSDSQQALPHKL